jgi:hypothetical protein
VPVPSLPATRILSAASSATSSATPADTVATPPTPNPASSTPVEVNRATTAELPVGVATYPATMILPSDSRVTACHSSFRSASRGRRTTPRSPKVESSVPSSL